MRQPATDSDFGITANARLILTKAHATAEAFLDAFTSIRRLRKAGRQPPTDEEQDLLRAMLVMAGAGLDAMVKQLIRDALPTLASTDSTVRQRLEEFVRRQLTKLGGTDKERPASRFLARVLVSETQWDQVIDEYVNDLTGNSLQSVEALNRSVRAFNVTPDDLGMEVSELRSIFGARNQIVHEFDVDLPVLRRSRRRDTELINYTNTLLATSERFLDAVAKAPTVDLAKQRTTMADLRSLGTATEAYAVDNNAYPSASTIEELRSVLEPVYIRSVPVRDGWGRVFEVRSAPNGYTYRSYGRNGKRDRRGGGPTSSFDADIIFADGEFEQWPEGPQR